METHKGLYLLSRLPVCGGGGEGGVSRVSKFKHVMESAARVPDDKMKIWIQPRLLISKAAVVFLILRPIVITVESNTSLTLKRQKKTQPKSFILPKKIKEKVSSSL